MHAVNVMQKNNKVTLLCRPNFLLKRKKMYFVYRYSLTERIDMLE